MITRLVWPFIAALFVVVAAASAPSVAQATSALTDNTTIITGTIRLAADPGDTVVIDTMAIENPSATSVFTFTAYNQARWQPAPNGVVFRTTLPGWLSCDTSLTGGIVPIMFYDGKMIPGSGVVGNVFRADYVFNLSDSGRYEWNSPNNSYCVLVRNPRWGNILRGAIIRLPLIRK